MSKRIIHAKPLDRLCHFIIIIIFLIYDILLVAMLNKRQIESPVELVINIGIKGEIRSPRFFSYLNSLYFAYSSVVP